MIILELLCAQKGDADARIFLARAVRSRDFHPTPSFFRRSLTLAHLEEWCTTVP